MNSAHAQLALVVQGLDLGTGGPSGLGDDGQPGALTRAAAATVQRANGLPETGVLDPATLAALEPFLPICIGDSITLGIATLSGMTLPHRAVVGVPSATVLAEMDAARGAKRVILSVGSNNPADLKLAGDLARIRAEASPGTDVVWVLPMHPIARALVIAEAAKLGDGVLPFAAGGDGVHPKAYPAVARDAIALFKACAQARLAAHGRAAAAPVPASAEPPTDTVRPPLASASLVTFAGPALRIGDEDLPRIGYTIGVGEDEIHAILDVEAGGSGFDAQGRPKMLFEPHVFYRHLSGAKLTQAVNAGLAYAAWRPGAYPADSYPRLKAAMQIDDTAGLKSASWGIGQILGENYVAAGYGSVQDMVRAFILYGEAEQLEAMVRFIRANHLDDELRAHNWAALARGYNGPQYARNGYHTKLAASFARWSRIRDTTWTPASLARSMGAALRAA